MSKESETQQAIGNRADGSCQGKDWWTATVDVAIYDQSAKRSAEKLCRMQEQFHLSTDREDVEGLSKILGVSKEDMGIFR